MMGLHLWVASFKGYAAVVRESFPYAVCAQVRSV